jgi:hypothetical protein
MDKEILVNAVKWKSTGENSCTLGEKEGLIFVTVDKWGKDAFHYKVRMNGEVIQEIHDFKTLEAAKRAAGRWTYRNVEMMWEFMERFDYFMD